MNRYLIGVVINGKHNDLVGYIYRTDVPHKSFYETDLFPDEQFTSIWKLGQRVENKKSLNRIFIRCR